MRVLITGASGQLGWELQRTAPAGAEIIALDHDKLDICDVEAVRKSVLQVSPHVIINAAAYTAVDRAEKEPDLAFAVNAHGPSNLIEAMGGSAVRLIQISTDFVFDGTQGYPYRPNDSTNPLCVYGASKRQGELAVLENLGDAGLVLRTSWVYSSHGHNFVKTMLRLLGEREEVGVVVDQVGTPTSAHDLAHVIWSMADSPELYGIHHWTNAGVASWYDFAVAIQEEALSLNILHECIPIKPLTTSEYRTSAKRPSFSVLDKSHTWKLLSKIGPHWRKSLRILLKEMANA
jgi:dTDP-4-dehydrorhamnose reductase